MMMTTTTQHVPPEIVCLVVIRSHARMMLLQYGDATANDGNRKRPIRKAVNCQRF
jgi:hypothetical protein